MYRQSACMFMAETFSFYHRFACTSTVIASGPTHPRRAVRRPARMCPRWGGGAHIRRTARVRERVTGLRRIHGNADSSLRTQDAHRGPLALESWIDRVERRKIYTHGTISHEGIVTAARKASSSRRSPSMMTEAEAQARRRAGHLGTRCSNRCWQPPPITSASPEYNVKRATRHRLWVADRIGVARRATRWPRSDRGSRPIRSECHVTLSLPSR